MAEKVVRSRLKRRRRLAKSRLVIGANWRQTDEYVRALEGEDNGAFVDEDGGATVRCDRQLDLRIGPSDDDRNHAFVLNVDAGSCTEFRLNNNNDSESSETLNGEIACELEDESNLKKVTTIINDGCLEAASRLEHVTMSPEAALTPANQTSEPDPRQQRVAHERSAEEAISSASSVSTGAERVGLAQSTSSSSSSVSSKSSSVATTTTTSTTTTVSATITTATTTTGSTWSLPCKLNGVGSRGHRKSRGCGGGGEHGEEERERRAQCFYRYRNLHPRAVAYLFARQNGEPARTTGHSRNPSPHYVNINNTLNNNSNGTSGQQQHGTSSAQCGPSSMPRRGEAEVNPNASGGGGIGSGIHERSARAPRVYSHHHGNNRTSAGNQDSSPPQLPSRPPPLPPTIPQEQPHGRGRGGRSRRVGEQNGGVLTTPAYHPPPPAESGTNAVLSAELLPDILNSHVPPPPPYSTLPPNGDRSAGGRRGVSAAPLLLPTVCPQPPPSPPHRPSFLAPGLSFIGGGRRHRSSTRRRSAGGSHYTPDDEPKHCCGVVVNQAVSIRWFILLIAFVGLCCAIVGTVLGALKTTGREHLTVSLLMIGVGIVLITVSGIAWRLTSTDAPSCRMMLGFHSADDSEPNRRFVPRVPPSYGRSHHPYAAMMYPEFQYRPPPPSYQASMQEYRLRLLLLDRQHTPTVTSLSPVSPPPTYRSHVSGRPPLTFARDSDYSRPPSYRSRSSSVMPRPNDGSQTAAGEPPTAVGSHSRDPSLSLSCLSHESLFNPSEANGLSGNGGSGTNLTETGTLRDFETIESTEIVVDSGGGNTTSLSSKALPVNDTDGDERLPQLQHSYRKTRDSNAVTIVQTTDSMQVLNPDSVIVTVPGQNSTNQQQQSPGLQGEVEILAHL